MRRPVIAAATLAVGLSAAILAGRARPARRAPGPLALPAGDLRNIPRVARSRLPSRYRAQRGASSRVPC